MAPPAELVLGTAGHIDHGKTALIRALTGVEPDRLPEEQRRGITIELGFAPLDLGDLVPGLRLGVVDVPGHERLVRTMVAGATGIDLVLLVVAADEGVMPQTLEHLAICDLLGLGRAVVALTKADLVDADVTALAVEEVEGALAGTRLAGAPVRPVSARTGAGLPALREALGRAAAGCPAATPRTGPPRLHVDRAFARRGFGTVVTGTLVGDGLAEGDAVELLPAHEGARREARVRGLQRFGEPAARVPPGARCAVNLGGVALEDVARGDVLSAPGRMPVTRVFDAELAWLAPEPLPDEPTSVELLVGTCERRARVAPIGAAADRADDARGGGRGMARVHVDGPPVALLPGDRFVLRGFARDPRTGATLGGGRVLDVAPPRRRRSDPALHDELVTLAAGDPVEAVRRRVARAGYAGASAAELALERGLRPDEAEALLAAAGDAVVPVGGGRFLAGDAAARLEARLAQALAAFHAAEPLRPGMPKAALRGALPANAGAAFEALLARRVDAGRVEDHAGLVRDPDFVPRLTRRQEAIAARLRADAMIAGLEPPTPREWAEELGVGEAELFDLLAYLERDGSLVRAPGDLWFDCGAVDELRERVAAHLREHGALTTPAYKELIGTTRKFAVPLMELFDAERLTARRGEERVLRGG